MRLLAALLACSPAVSVAFVSCSDDPPEAPRPSVLLISIDSLRRDLVGAYGFESPFAPGRSSSPTIDALAERGVLFENAYSTTSWTLPSHLTMLTGHPELLHGVDIDYHEADPERKLLSEHLRAEGYRTAGYYSGPYLDADFGFDRGFDQYDACYGPNLTRAAAQLAQARLQKERAQRGETGLPSTQELARRLNQANLAVEHESHRDVSSRSVADSVVQEFEAAAGGTQPLFVFAHLFDPHYDYVAPAPFHTAFDPDYAGPVDGTQFMQDPDVSRPHPNPTGPGMRQRVASDRDMQHVRALYAGELAWVDAQIERMLQALEATGFADNTIVIVTSDHGDEFFEHGSLGHRNTLYEEITRVPMIISWPGRTRAGVRESALVSNVDLVPTVLDWLGIDVDTTGTSLVALLEGERDAADRHVLGRMVAATNVRIGAPGSQESMPAQHLTVTESYHEGSLKLIRERSWPSFGAQILEQLPPAEAKSLRQQALTARAKETLRWIDLVQNPGERLVDFSNDFSAEPARGALARWRDRYVELNAERASAIAAGRNSGTVDRSQHDAMLRGTGYVGGDEPTSERVPPGQFSLPAPGSGR